MTHAGPRIRRALIALLLLAFTAHAGGVLSLAQAAPTGGASGITASSPWSGELPVTMARATMPAPGGVMAMPACPRVAACTPYILPDGPRLTAPQRAPVERTYAPAGPPEATAVAIETPPPR